MHLACLLRRADGIGFGTSVWESFLIAYLVCFGMATLQGGGLPRWTGYVALGAAGLAVLAYLQVVPPALGPVFGVPGWILHIAWTVGITVSMLRGRARMPSHSFRYEPAGVSPD